MSKFDNRVVAVGALFAAVTLGLAAHAATPLTLVKPTAYVAPKGVSPTGKTTRYIVRYRNLTTASALTSVRTAVTLSGIAGLSARHVRRLATGADVIAVSRPLDTVDSASLMAALKADPAVAYVAPDRRMYPTATVNDPYTASHQWHYSHSYGGMYAPGAWDVSRGNGVVVAVLDTGVIRHPDLDANMLEGYDFITDPFVSRRKTEGRAPGGNDLGDWNDDPSQCDIRDSTFHGTHVSGTIAEVSNNGQGMAGVAHNARVLPVRVLGRCGGYTSDIADAIIWASGGSVPGVPDNANPAEVINMSLGGGGECDATMQSAIDSAVSRGTTVVVSSGNSASDARNFVPANCSNVISVGATGITGGRAFYSNYGPAVDISAPGGNGYEGNPNGYVWSTGNDSATSPELGNPVYVGMIGTSMAAPHVSATVALMQAVVSTPLTPAEIESRLKATARPLPVASPVPMGAGILNAKAALATIVPCQGPNCESAATAVANKVPVRSLAGAVNSERLYKVTVPAGKTYLSLMTYGGLGDVSLLVRYGQTPMNAAGQYDMASVRPGNSETIRYAVVRPGTYYIKVIGKAAYSGVTLEVRHD